LGCFGLSATETVVGSNAEPTSRLRACPPPGRAESSTTSSIATTHSANPRWVGWHPVGWLQGGMRA
jgi:hypothetical protein